MRNSRAAAFEASENILGRFCSNVLLVLHIEAIVKEYWSTSEDLLRCV